MTSNIDDMTASEMNSSSDLQIMDTSPDSIIPESDNDSGIVAIANNNRIGSTASNSDEDHQSFKDKVNQSLNHHSISYGPKPRVRFDDELPLSEQNMRKSCKKLFETLLQQNKDNPTAGSVGPIGAYNNDSGAAKSSALLPACQCHRFAQSLPSMTKNNSCNNCGTNSDLNLNTVESFDDNELLITTYGRQCNYGREPPVTRRQKYHTLDNRKTRSHWALDNSPKGRTFEDIDRSGINCDAALDRIKRMSDELESASMVNAFARPAFIKSAEFAQTMDTLYETIYPTEKPVDNSVHSANSHVNRWLNNNKLDSFESTHNTEQEVCGAGNRDVNVLCVSSPSKQLSSDSRKSILKAIPNDIRKVNALSPTKSSYISADQIYPDQYDGDDDDDITNDRLGLNASFDDRVNQRFSHSYSAGDDMKKGILRNRMKGAISEIDLNQTKLNSSSPTKSKSFLQRFKSVFTRAFNTDKSLSKSVVNMNTVHNSARSLSQTDLRINCNPKGSSTSIAQTGAGSGSSGGPSRIDRSPSFVKNIRNRMSLRRANRLNSPEKHEKMSRSYSHKTLLSHNQKSQSLKAQNFETNECSESLDRIWGELIKLNSDSSQVIQIRRQKGRAFGFFVARGTVNHIKGVFVSRMKDEETQKCLTGVLEIGDEILAIDGESVKEANIMRVNQLIANKDTIRLTIIPYMNNKYL